MRFIIPDRFSIRFARSFVNCDCQNISLINLVAVSPTGKGNLQAFPVGAGSDAGLSVNYNAIDTNLANAGTVKIISGTGPDITVASNFSSAHMVIDVLGYYNPSPKTCLNTTSCHY